MASVVVGYSSLQLFAGTLAKSHSFERCVVGGSGFCSVGFGFIEDYPDRLPRTGRT